MTARRLLTAALRIACCVVLLVWALSQVEFGAVLATMTPRLGAVVAAGSIAIAATAWVQAARWRIVARALRAPLDERSSLRATLLSYFLLTVTPATVAADGARVVVAGRVQGAWSGAALAVVLDRGYGLIALLLLALAGLPAIAIEAPRLFLPVAVPVAALGLAALATTKLLAIRLPRSWLRSRTVVVWARLVSALRATLTDRRTGARALVLSLAIIAASLAAFWAIAWTVGARADVGAMLALFPSMLLLSVLPISVNGWGVRELSLVAMYPHLGTSANEAMAVSLAFGLAVLGAGLLSLVAWWFMGSTAFRRSGPEAA